jgi:asparagine synthase (glutamine-hydrolysing)
MCGICGIFNFTANQPVEAGAIARMTRTIVHRGPDDDGTYFSGSLGLGFRRLSIIDLSPAGHQPMSDAERQIWVIFNGEIYNYLELRKELEALGRSFRSNSDTEVIVQGYKQWGEDVLNRLNGMFGLAIWDEPRRRLIVARDAMGIKPVYYAVRDGSLYFGSEIRPVLAGLQTRRTTDPVALNLFLRYRYTPSPFTLFAGIRKLAAGERLTVANGSYKIDRWYRYVPEAFGTVLSAADAQERLFDLYKAAVKRHLISDVPVGLLLSGGIDSGLLLGLMSLHGRSWPTFTVGYGNKFKDDEIEDAAETARIYSASNNVSRLDRHTFEEALPKIVDVVEEPVASSSIVPMYFVSERARQDVKVALIGQGPDELFGGYNRHLGVRYGSHWRKLPKMLRSSIAGFVNSLPRQEALKRAMFSVGVDDRMRRYQQIFSIQRPEIVDSLFQDGLLPKDVDEKALECWKDLEPAIGQQDELNGFHLLELRSSLPDELLMYGDKLSMAHSLEVRVPYLDREVVEYVQRLGPQFKVRNGSRKWLHRRVCSDFLPREIIQRKKRGFAVNVVDDWFRESIQGKMAGYLLDPQSLMYGFLRPEIVRRLLEEHKSSRQDNHKILFSLVVFEQSLRSSEVRAVENVPS